MKTQFASTTETISGIFKQMLYALQVLIIALAIPVLSYLELSHKDNDQPSGKNAGSAITIKADATAYNVTGK